MKRAAGYGTVFNLAVGRRFISAIILTIIALLCQQNQAILQRYTFLILSHFLSPLPGHKNIGWLNTVAKFLSYRLSIL